MQKKYKTVLFDLDGTLSESGEGIRQGIEYALDKMGVNIPDLSDYSLYVGPPLRDTFKKIAHLDEKGSAKALSHYSDFYLKHGKYKNKLYDGIEELLKKLVCLNVRLAVATTKNERFASWVVSYIGVSEYFEIVSGVTPDYKIGTKQQVIENALRRMDITDKSQVVLIGDSGFDAQGAKLSGTDFIGALYGYGKKEDMIKYDADKFVTNVHQLTQMLITE